MVQISGTTAAAETKGIQTYEDGTKTGVGVTLKHFAFNNQESERFNNNSVMSERAAREIYLKGFQIASRESTAGLYYVFLQQHQWRSDIPALWTSDGNPSKRMGIQRFCNDRLESNG